MKIHPKIRIKIIWALLALVFITVWDYALFRKTKYARKEVVQLVNIDLHDTIIYEVENAFILFDKEAAEMELMAEMVEAGYVDNQSKRFLRFVDSLPSNCLFDKEAVSRLLIRTEFNGQLDTMSEPYYESVNWVVDTTKIVILDSDDYYSNMGRVVSKLLSKGKVRLVRKSDNQAAKQIVFCENWGEGWSESYFELSDGLFILSGDFILYM